MNAASLLSSIPRHRCQSGSVFFALLAGLAAIVTLFALFALFVALFVAGLIVVITDTEVDHSILPHGRVPLTDGAGFALQVGPPLGISGPDGRGAAVGVDRQELRVDRLPLPAGCSEGTGDGEKGSVAGALRDRGTVDGGICCSGFLLSTTAGCCVVVSRAGASVKFVPPVRVGVGISDVADGEQCSWVEAMESLSSRLACGPVVEAGRVFDVRVRCAVGAGESMDRAIPEAAPLPVLD